MSARAARADGGGALASDSEGGADIGKEEL
jgi:hypothetical protein